MVLQCREYVKLVKSLNVCKFLLFFCCCLCLTILKMGNYLNRGYEYGLLV